MLLDVIFTRSSHFWAGIENARILPNRPRINLSIWNPWALSTKNRVFSVTVTNIQPLRAYRRALLAPPSTSDGPHRQTRELNIERLDTRVSQMLVFPQREAFLEIPTRFGKTASRPRVTYFPGATSLGDPNYQKRILLN